VKKRYREASDATLQFCKECLKKEKGHEVVLKEAYDRFRLYCQENGFRDIPTKPQFTKTLQGEKLVIRSSTRQQNKVTIRGHRLVG
jgi:phage/plasmid-associated DNA primase